MFIVSVHFRTLPYAATCNISILGYANERSIHLPKHVRIIDTVVPYSKQRRLSDNLKVNLFSLDSLRPCLQGGRVTLASTRTFLLFLVVVFTRQGGLP